MNFFLIKNLETLKNENVTKYWQLLLLKSILLIASIILFVLLIISPPEARAEIFYVNSGGGILLFIAFVLLQTPKYLTYFSWLLISLVSSNIIYTSFVSPFGDISPLYSHIPVILFATLALLGFKAVGFMTLVFLTLLAGHGFGLFAALGIPSLRVTYSPATFHLYLERFISVIVIYAVLYVFHRILRSTNLDLVAERHRAANNEKHAILSRVAAGFAHEINNPLGIAFGYIGIAQSREEEKEKPDEAMLKMYENTTHALERIQTTVSKFLAIFNKKENPFRTIELCEMVLSVIANNETNVKVSIDRSLSIRSDAEALREIVQSLNLNALEAVKDRPDGLVEWSTENNNTLICSDNGAGFKDHQFEAFLRPFVTTKYDSSGRGLGLFVAATYCEAIGAKITEQRLNNITIIKVLFPTKFRTSKS